VFGGHGQVTAPGGDAGMKRMARRHPDKMTFLEHLEELRQRLVHVLI
jgi:hypothetical protein